MCAFLCTFSKKYFCVWTKEEELKNQQLHLRCEKSNSPPKLFLFLIRIFTRTFSFAFSAARTPHIALHSTHNVCLVCTIVRGFREVRRNRFASDRASPRYDFPFFESFLFLFFACVKIASGKIGEGETTSVLQGEKCVPFRIERRRIFPTAQSV